MFFRSLDSKTFDLYPIQILDLKTEYPESFCIYRTLTILNTICLNFQSQCW